MEVQALSPEVIQDTETSIADDSIPAEAITSTFSSDCIDLISAPLSSRILSTSDEYFAAAPNLLTPTSPIRRQNHYVHTGAWFDGWETRRHNPSPYDWVIVKLGVASGIVRGVEIDTAFFDGNHAPEISVEGCFEIGDGADETVTMAKYASWRPLLGRRECGPSRRHGWIVHGETAPVTHARLLMWPDGGIARFRLYGVAVPVWPADREEEVELSAAVMGGVAVSCSDEHFGKRQNLLLPGRGKDMGDGWETRRSRGAGHVDWVVVRLGGRGVLSGVVVDTKDFRGNFPRGVRVEGGDFGDGEAGKWVEVLGERKVGPDGVWGWGVGEFGEGAVGRAFTHVRLVILPDGGVKRFRVFGVRA